jgi:hypothetical protein
MMKYENYFEHWVKQITCPSNITRVINSEWFRWTGHTTPMGEMRIAYTVFAGEAERKISLGK